MRASRTLTVAEAKAFYDRFGAMQDTQAFYEDGAVDALIAHSDFEHARAVLEFGCGTGRVAARLLANVLREDCRYRGVDISETMVALARRRLRPWAPRAEVVLSPGALPSSPDDAGTYDRFLSTFVLDLMSDEGIAGVLAEAHRLLGPGGRLCLVGLTRGRGPVASAWALLHRLSPMLVGGCRAIELRDHLDEARWRLAHHEVISRWGISSEVVVAAPGDAHGAS
jgi:SAM-dependent methyltransferase